MTEQKPDSQVEAKAGIYHLQTPPHPLTYAAQALLPRGSGIHKETPSCAHSLWLIKEREKEMWHCSDPHGH